MTEANNKTKSNSKLPIITLILGTLFGSGGVWKYMDYKLADERLGMETVTERTKTDIELNRLELEKKHQKLEEKYRILAAKNDDLRLVNETLDTNLKRATHTTQWRKDLEGDLISIINLTHDFKPLDLCSGKATPTQKNTALELRQQLEFKRENFERLELEIASFESRSIRDVNLQFSPPCPPTGLSVK
jgi:hypothetical protein